MKRKPRLVRIPMSKALYDSFSMQLHTSLATLRTAPCLEAYDAIGWLFNVVAVVVEKDDRFKDDLIHLYSGIRMMNQIQNKCAAGLPLKDYELACLFSAVQTVDEILPRLDVSKIHLANLHLKAQL